MHHIRSRKNSILPSMLVAIACFINSSICAQQPATGFSREVLSDIDKKFNDQTIESHSSIQPLLSGYDHDFFIQVDSTIVSAVKENQFSLSPVFSGSIGLALADSSGILGNGFAGFRASWSKGVRWYAQAGYSVAGGVYPTYIGNTAESMHFLPGTGYAVSDGNDVFHSHYTYGSLAFNEGKHFHFELGKSKHFWGDGYRSLILSDNASSFPYLKVTTNVWKLRYTNLWVQLKDISQGQFMRDARTKYAALHALSFNAHKKFNWTIYEMVVWQDRDTMNHRTLDIGYLNPIIFYRPVEYAVGSPDNVILATSMKYKVHKNFQLYGQFVLDEFNLKQFKLQQKWWANKLAGQLGFKWFDIIPGLGWQTEANIARPFIYTHGSSIQSWTHINQPMAHPLGANFLEWVNFINYKKGKWHLQEQFNWAGYGRDKDADGNGTFDNFGGNITRSYRDPFGGPYGHEMMQGEKSNLLFHQFTIARALDAAGSTELFLRHTWRNEKSSAIDRQDHFIAVGIKMTGLLQPTTDY